jgi:hypothetical protein
MNGVKKQTNKNYAPILILFGGNVDDVCLSV